MTLTYNVIGVDIAKRWIDVHHLSTGQHARIDMEDKSLKAFIKTVPEKTRFILEASGGYERPLCKILAESGLPYIRVNPRQAREFARATGCLAKTDKVDARSLAQMGEALKPDPTPPPDPARDKLAALVAFREDLVADRVAHNNRLHQATESFIRSELKSLIRLVKARIAKVETQIEKTLMQNPALSQLNSCLQSAPGIGPVTAASLIARLPELGRVNRRAIAALAGLAPHACDSGLKTGKRRTWGGRQGVRRSLYQAAFIASRYDPALKAYRQHLIDKGKPFKVAIIATARKLLTQLNAIVREKRNYQKTV